MKHRSLMILGIAAAILSTFVGLGAGFRVGYDRGSQDASCYALQAAGSTLTPLPVDYAPCPAERRP